MQMLVNAGLLIVHYCFNVHSGVAVALTILSTEWDYKYFMMKVFYNLLSYIFLEMLLNHNSHCRRLIQQCSHSHTCVVSNTLQLC